MNTLYIIACGKDEDVILAKVKDDEVKARSIARGISTDCTEVMIVVRNESDEALWEFRRGMEVDW